MNETVTVFAATWILVALLLIIQPWLSRKNVLFGAVFGSDDIWTDKTAQKIRLRYLLVMISGIVLLSILAVLYFIFAKPSDDAAVALYITGLFVLILYATVIFAVFHTATLSFKAGRARDTNLVDEKISVETTLSDKQTVLSYAWLLLFLPLLLCCYAVFLFYYPEMLANIPAYTGFNAWMQILLPVITGTAVTAILIVCCILTRRAPASVRGNPEAAPEAFRFRKAMIFLMIFLGAMVQLMSLILEIDFLVPVSSFWLFLPLAFDLIIAAAIFWIYFRYVRVKKPKGPILDDDKKWAIGMFYYNPSDPSLFIEKRNGIGYTLNFARPAAWIFFIGILAFIIVITVFSLNHN